MQVTSQTFKSNASVALRDAALQRALKNLKAGFPGKRAAAIAKLPEFDQLRAAGRDLKNHVLEHLDFYLERFEAKVIAVWIALILERIDTAKGMGKDHLRLTTYRGIEGQHIDRAIEAFQQFMEKNRTQWA